MDLRHMTFMEFCCHPKLFACFRKSRVLPKPKSANTLSSEVISNINNLGVLDPQALRLPLREREVYTVMRTWESVRRDMANAGISLFIRMFETTPEVREAFEKFRTLDECQELSQSSVMEIHGMAVMNAIDEIISNLDDESILVDIILNQGKAHARFGDLTETMFWAIESPFMHTIHNCLGKQSTPAVRELYRKTIRFILYVMVAGFLREHQDRAKEGGYAAATRLVLREAGTNVLPLTLSPGSAGSTRERPAPFKNGWVAPNGD